MADLVFATEGQAQVLAAQESVARKARETKAEFEAGAKATKSWDAEMAKLARQGESALRSIRTEQEKIADRISIIKENQEKGLIPPEEAEKAIRRLEQRWVAVDSATLAAKDQSDAFAREQAKLKSSAESAIESVRTEFERVEEQIREVRAAADQGLIDPHDAEEAIDRLERRLEGLGEKTQTIGERINLQLGKALSIDRVIKVGVGLVGVNAIRRELQQLAVDAQSAIDTAAKFGQSEEEAGFALARELARRASYGPQRSKRAFRQAQEIAAGANISRSKIYAILGELLGEGTDLDTALHAISRYAPLYPDKPGDILARARDFIAGKAGGERLPTREEIESIIPGGAPKLGRGSRQQSREEDLLRRVDQLLEERNLATTEELARVERIRQALGVDRGQFYASTVSARTPWSEGGTSLTRTELASALESLAEIARKGGGLRYTQETDQQLLQAVKEMADELRGLREDVSYNGGGP